MSPLKTPAPRPLGAPTRAVLVRTWLWMLALNVLLALAISTRYWGTAKPPNALDAAFLALSATTEWTVLAAVAGLPILALLLIVPRRSWIQAAVVLLPAGLTLLVADTIVYAIYHFHIDPFFLVMLGNGGGEGFFDLSARSCATIAACLIALAGAEVGLLRLAERIERRQRLRRAGWAVAIALLGVVLVTNGLHAWASAVGRRDLTGEDELLPGFHGLTANTFLRAHGWAPADDAVVPELTLPTSAGLHYPRSPLRCPGAPLPDGTTRPDILLIVVESLRADAMRADVMPATTAFAAENLNFTEHYSSGNSTQPGLGGLLYGIDATYWDSIANADGAGGPALVQALDHLGYRFGAFSSRDTLQRLRFDRYFFGALARDRVDLAENDGRPNDSDVANVDHLRDFLAADAATPAFGLVFFDSTHHRYSFPSAYVPRFLPTAPAEITAFSADTDPTPYKNQYLNAAGFVDEQIGRLLADLASSGRLDDTIVVLTGDHGESFNERRADDWGHGLDFGEVQTHVPLVVHWPGKAAGTVDHVTTHLDVAGTLLRDALGCENPLRDYTSGLDLFDDAVRKDRVVAGYVGYGIVTRSEIVSSMAGSVHITDRDLSPKTGIDDREGFAAGVAEMEAFYQ